MSTALRNRKRRSELKPWDRRLRILMDRWFMWPTTPRKEKIKLRILKVKPSGKRWRIQGSRKISWQRTASKGENGDWAAMPADALAAIFERLGAIDILLSAQFVCRSWQQASHDPCVWRCVEFITDYWDRFDINIGDPFKEMMKVAVDRSKGLIEEFCADHIVEDGSLLYMAQRSKKLKRLELIYRDFVSDAGLVQICRLCPQLEDLCISYQSFGNDLFQDLLDRHCPTLLKRFCLNNRGARNAIVSNREALSIARNMPHLRELELFGNHLSNEGLRAILDGCPHLQTLDLRHCFNVDLGDEDIKARSSGLKKLWSLFDHKKEYCSPFEKYW